MFWPFLLALHVLIGNLFATWLIKKLASQPQRSGMLLLQYAILALVAGALSVVYPQSLTWQVQLPIIILGALNSLACFAQWRAMEISVSRAALFSVCDDLVAMLLAYLVLGEGREVSAPMIVGIVLCFCSSMLIAAGSGVGGRLLSSRLLIWVAVYSLIWGLVPVAMRASATEFAISGIGFMALWYLGSLLGSVVIWSTLRKGEPALPSKVFPMVLLLAGAVLASKYLCYLLLTQLTVLSLQPILQLTEMIVPFLLGVLVFKERVEHSARGWISVGLGICGVLLIAVSL